MAINPNLVSKVVYLQILTFRCVISYHVSTRALFTETSFVKLLSCELQEPLLFWNNLIWPLTSYYCWRPWAYLEKYIFSPSYAFIGNCSHKVIYLECLALEWERLTKSKISENNVLQMCYLYTNSFNLLITGRTFKNIRNTHCLPCF